jgi:hypothetical protein
MKRWLIAFGILVVFVIFLMAMPWIEYHFFVWNYVDDFASRTGLNTYLVRALGCLLFIPFYIGTGYAIKFWNQRKQLTGIAIILALVAVYNTGFYFATKDHYRRKCYVRTPEGIEIRECTSDGKDPVYGLPLKPVTPEVIIEVMSLQKGCNLVDPRSTNFFNKTMGEPQIWYYRRPNGTYDFFDGPCHHPELGVRLEPVSRDVVRDWKSQETTRKDTRRQQGKKQRTGEGRRTDEGRTEEQRMAETEAIAERKRQKRIAYRKQYLNTDALERLRGDGPVTLIAAEGNDSIENRLARKLQGRSINAQSGILKAALFRSGVSDQLTNGDRSTLQRLGLSQFSGRLILCRLSLGELTDTGRLLKTRAFLSTAVVPLDGGRVIQRRFDSRGAGFDAHTARKQATTRVLDDLLSSSVVSGR